MKYPSHGEYKTSDSAWLPTIPATWQQIRGRFVMSVNPAAVRLRDLDETDEVSFVPMEAVGENGGLNLERTKPLDEIGSGYTEFEDGDVVIAKITPCFENGKSAIASGLMNGVAFGTTELHVLRAGKRLDKQFLFHLTTSHTFRMLGESEMYGAGGQKRVPPEFAKDFRIPLPPLDEQQTIARFLDAKTAQIDDLIAKKRQLIAKLKEKRSALIARTVTRGLPPEAAEAAGLEPHPEMKNSGVEWLGQIPEHWQLASLFRVAQSIQTGPFGTQLHHADYVDDEVPLINPIHLVDGKLQPDSKNTVTPETAERLSRYKLTSGEIVLARRGDIGRCSVVLPEHKGWLCGTGSMVVRLHGQFCDSHYYSLVFQSTGFRSLLELNAVGTTMLNLNPSILGRMLVPVPALVEQQLIVVFIRNETAKIDSLIQQVESAITRLTEYRQALISSAVTGKIDVRETPTLPEAA